MKKTTKFISLLLAVLMVCSCFAGLTVMTAGAAETPSQKIYFKYPETGAWGDPSTVKVNNRNKTAAVYCYVYSIYGNENPLKVFAFGANGTACTAEGNNVYSFDMAKYSTVEGVAAIEDNADYGIIISAKNGNTYQTTDLTMSKECLGDSIVITEMTPTRENAADSSKKDFCAKWENTTSCGMRASITSLNNVLDGAFPSHMPKAKPLSDQLKKYLTNATNLPFYQWEQTEMSKQKGGGCNKTTCEKLGVTAREVYDQYVSDNAEAIATGAVHPADDLSPVEYIEYEGYNDAGVLTTMKMAAPSAVAAALNLEYPVEEPTTAEPTTVEPTTVEPTTVEPTTEPAPETIYSIAGDPFNNWDATDLNTEMTKGDDGKYTYTTAMEPVQNAQFKVVTNHSWDEAYGDNGNNVVFNVDTACDVTITFDPETKEITVTGDGVSEPTLEIDKIRAVGNGEGNWLNGVAWDPADDANLMSEVADGIYEITFNNVAESFGYELKFAANGDWVANWGGVEGNTTVSGTTYDGVWDGKNINIEIEESGATVKAQLDLREFNFKEKTGAKYTVTITYPEPEPTTVEPTTVEPTTVEPTTVEPITVEPTTVEPTTEPVEEMKVYSIAGDPFNSWDASDLNTEMTAGDDGLYTYTVAMDPVQNAQFKVVTNHSWDEAYGDNGNNVVFNVDTACDVTITFNEVTKEITVTGDGVSEPTLEIDKIRAVGNGEGNWLNGVAWDPADDANLMSEVADGIYEITFENVAESFGYELKFAANGDWVANWGGVEGNTTVSGTTYDGVWDGKNINIEIEESGATVKAQLDLREFNFKEKTGAKYTITIEYPEQEGVILGDVDGDGQVTIDDATMLQQGLVKIVNLDDTATFVGDVNGDGKLSIMDVTFIQRYLTGNTADAYGYANKTGTFVPSN